DACDAEEPVAETFAALIEADRVELSWLAPGPWPQMANEARRFASRSAAFARTTAVASSELVLALREPSPACPPPVTWRCVGDALISGALRVGAPPGSSPYRVLIRAALLTGYFDRSDYATNDVEEAAATEWIAAVDRAIERARAFGATSLRDFLVKPGSADGFITIGVDAGRTPVEQLSPPVRVDATLGGAGAAPVRPGERLVEAGWGPPRGEEQDDGLPSPGVLLALRDL
ncbi:MAG TPA: hypothetical protein VFV35_07470, partial [Acidimicrobiales bacterium]|nr:hypothetical protein [Acidimicrobiales bacterium]